MICSTDPSKFESSKLLEIVVSLLNAIPVGFLHAICTCGNTKAHCRELPYKKVQFPQGRFNH